MKDKDYLKKSNLPLVCIGMPVYNGEKFIRKSIDSVLNQTFTDFELIISDNASTDSTPTICTEYVKKDNRVHYIRQEKNINMLPNYNFVLRDAKTKYFVWLEYDDFWYPNFLERNIRFLEMNQDFIASIGNIKYYGNVESNLDKKTIVSRIKNSIKHIQNINSKFKYVHPVSGSYDKKIDFYLRFDRGSGIYAVYLTNVLQKSTIKKSIASWDLIIILNALRYGNLHVFEEILMERYALGTSSKGAITGYRHHQINLLDLLLPNSTFVIYTTKNLGKKFFLRNLDWFVLVLAYGWFTIIQEIKDGKYRN